MLEEEKNKKKEWVEPELTKGEDLSFTLVTMMAYGTNKDNGGGCGIFEKIITLGQC